MRVLATMIAVLVVVVAASAASGASGAGRAGPTMLYGIQDDAYLEYGPGTAAERVANLQHLGIGIVRFTLRWDAVEGTAGNKRLGAARQRPRGSPGCWGSMRS